jgi:hypothetical protein
MNACDMSNRQETAGANLCRVLILGGGFGGATRP